jgi:hypothetical protein
MNRMLEQAVVRAIEQHLDDHPQAADSASGVARWWLQQCGISASVGEVEQVLAAMVRRQRLRCVRLADGTLLYARRLDPRH